MTPIRRLPGPRPAAVGDDTKWLLYPAVLVLLLKNPTMIYLTFHRGYKVMYIAAIVAIAADYCAVLARGRSIHLAGILGTKLYALFVYLSLAVLLVDGIISQRVDMEKTVQFVMNICQFFVILYGVMRFGQPMRIVAGAYRVAVVLAALSLVVVLGNYAGAFPFPGIPVPFSAWESGVMYFYFPFGFAHEPLPMSPSSYRSYSFFSEPAYFAMFLIPFLFYAEARARATRRPRHVICFAVLGAGALFTYSVAGAVVAWLTLLSVSLYGLVARPVTWPRHCAVLCLLLVVSACLFGLWERARGSAGDPRLHRAMRAVEDRQLQWSTAMSYTANHVFGEGIGYSVAERVFWRAVKRRDRYAEFTNILELVYYLGLVYLVPLSLLLLGVARHVLAGLRSLSPYTRALAAMMWFLLLYNGSVQVFFTGYFSLMLGSFLLILTQERAARAALCAPVAVRAGATVVARRIAV